ncbi:Mannosylglycerate hydrolase [Streptomyces sp. YIM 130001]|uniref:glycoside hydrolase family 38 N-terminal domain-containing protein n=1 Tax=Streptomyces sp. YIM 130001 TaxID=2259644 RepID=UPI000E65398D|nr:hypothetical protein [Streptomyces sp. YIM 130001]RII09252.1 Mannosylglycerate hydrolase [Streptomyces sp. YIM 130001]
MTTDPFLWEATPAPRSEPWPVVDGLPTLVVDTERPWPAVHPGIHDADGGHRAHRIVAAFRLEAAEDTVLHLEYAAERGPCPDLEITLDGRHRSLHHLPVERNDRTRTGDPGPVSGHGTLRVELPAAWLSPGDHELTVTTVLDEEAATGAARPDAPEAAHHPGEKLPLPRTQYGKWFGSYLRWTTVRIERATTPMRRVPTYALRTTPLHLHGEPDPIPLVELTANLPAGGALPSRLTLEHSGGSITVPDSPGGRDFGMVRWRLPAPGFTSPADFTVHADGAEVHRAGLAPSRRWTLHLIPHVHLDLGFTDTQAKSVELHCRNIDKALERLEHDSAFRFSVDGAYIVQEYLRTRSPRRCARLREAIGAGLIGVNTFHSNLLTGITHLEELRRALDFGLTLPPAPGAVPRYANITDVPTWTSALPSVLRTAGVDAFVGMSNHHRAATDDSDEVHLASPVRWQAPDGSEVLAHFADHYSQLRFIAADPQAVAGAVNGLERYTERYERPDYLPCDLALIGTHADNEDLADGDTGFAERWNGVFAYPRIQVSTFADYLDAIEPLRDRLPVHRAEGGSFWEDGPASSAVDAAAYRQAQVLLPAAEQLAASVQLLDDRYRPHREALDRAWDGLIIGGEHTWNWARATAHPHAPQIGDQLHWKRRAIDDAARIALDESRRALSQLAASLGVDGPCVLVHNPHPWPATLTAELDLLEGSVPLDAEGRPVPFEVLSDCAGMLRTRLVLEEMPAFGYRCMPLSTGAATVPAGEGPAAVSAGETADERTPVRPVAAGRQVTSQAWEVRLRTSDGLPTGLRHRPSGRELLDGDAPFALGELVRLTASGAADSAPHDRTMIGQLDSRYHQGSPTPLVADRPAMRLLGARSTPDGIRLRWEGTGAGATGITLELLLRDSTETCELTVELTKQPVLDMESTSIAFPFLVHDPTVRYDRQLGWVEPAADHGPGSSNEWLSATSAVTVTGPDGPGVIWSAPDSSLFSSSDLVRGTWPTRFSETNGHLYAYVMNNFWPCNTAPAQPGPVRFRYVFAPVARHVPEAASRFGAEARLGALAQETTLLDRFPEGRPPRSAEGTLPGLGALADCRIGVSAPAEGRLTLRLANLRADENEVAIQLPYGYRPLTLDAARTDTPRPDADGTLRVRLPRYGLTELHLACESSPEPPSRS